MLTKTNKEQLRGTIFRHLDGIATATTTYALHKKGVLKYLLENKNASLEDLTSNFKANEGYLNVALRILCSQGWLIQNLDNETNSVSYQTNELSRPAFQLAPLYEDVTRLLNYSVKFPEERIGADTFIILERIFKNMKINLSLKTSKKIRLNFKF